MDNDSDKGGRESYIYYIEMPLQGHDNTWYTVARALTPHGCAEVVKALCANPSLVTMQLRVEIRREL